MNDQTKDPLDMLPIGMDPRTKIAIAEFCENATRNYGKPAICKDCGEEYYCPQLAWEQSGDGLDLCRPCGLKREKKRCGVPLDYMAADLEFDYAYTDKQIEELLTFGHFFTGAMGAGKTHLNFAVLGQLLWRGVRSIRYTEFHPMTRSMRKAYKAPDYLSEERILQRYTSPLVLFIDEVFGSRGKEEYPTDEENHMFYEIVRARASNRLQTFITSNYSLEMLEDKGFNVRTLDRIRTMCRPVILDGTQKKNKGPAVPNHYTHPQRHERDDEEERDEKWRY